MATKEKKVDQSKDSEYYLQILKTPKWRSELSDEEIKSGTCQAVSILQFMAITATDYAETPDNIMNKKAKLLLDSLMFLNKKDLLKVVKSLRDLIALDDGYNVNVAIKLDLATLQLNIRNTEFFRVVAIIALRNMLPILRNMEESGPLLSDIFNLSLHFLLPRSPYVVYYVQTLFLMLRSGKLKVEYTEGLLLLILANCIVKATNPKAVKFADRMSDFIVSKWEHTEKFMWYTALVSLCQWETFHCQIGVCLIKHWSSAWVLPQIKLLVCNLAVTLTKNITAKSAITLLEISIRYIDLDTWNNVFMAKLIETVPQDDDAQRSFMRGTMLQCVNIAVKHYGIILYHHITVLNMDICYRVLVLQCCVQHDLVSTYNYRQTVCNLLNQNNEFIQYYSMKMLCIFNKKHFEIREWHLNMIEAYLQNVVFLSIGYYCEEMKYFISHLCVVANEMVRKEKNPPKIKMYVVFLSSVYRFCMENLQSKNEHRISVAAKVFDTIQDVFTESSSILHTKYTLNNYENYETGRAPFLRYLKRIKKWPFGGIKTLNVLFKDFVKSEKMYIGTANLLKKWCATNLDPNAKELDLLFRLGMSLLQHRFDHDSVEKGRQILLIIFASKGKLKKTRMKLVETIFCKWLHSTKTLDFDPSLINGNLPFTIYGLTQCVYDLFVYDYVDIKHRDEGFLFHICKSCQIAINVLARIYPNFDNAVNGNTGKKEKDLNTPKVKNIEHAIMALLDVIKFMLEAKKLPGITGPALYAANSVILASCGRRPVAYSAAFIRNICGNILSTPDSETTSSDDEQVVIIKFLEKVLFSIYIAPENQTSKLRRNPEHRLLIHSIVVADKRRNHPFLARAMDFLLHVLSDSSTNNSSKAAALHTLEVLVADNTIRNSTFPYISSITIHCINEFSSNDWRIKNAAVQVVQGIVNRLAGQRCNTGNRRYTSINDIFMLCPQLAIYFYSELENSSIQSRYDSIIAILALFSESHCKPELFLTKAAYFIISCFANIFISLTCNNSTVIGLFAAKAYAAIYPHAYIPFIMRDIIEWLHLNFYKMSKNIFCSFICLLKNLYENFNITPNVFYYKRGLCMIQYEFQRLLLFLERFNDQFEFTLFSSLGIISNRLSVCEKTIFSRIQKNTYQTRLWLYINIPHVLRNVQIEKFPDFLKKCLHQPLTLSLQLHCLNGILKRFDELLQNSLTQDILLVVLNKFLQLSDTCDYLVRSYSHVILLLFDTCNFTVAKDLIMRLRNSYDTVDKNIYALAAYVAVLSHLPEHTNADRTFIKHIIVTYKNDALIEDVEVQLLIASTLRYLYKCTEISNRHDILKTAFILLLNKETGSEICKFIALVLEVKFSSVFVTLQTLLSMENLIKQFKNPFRAATFLVDLTYFMSSLNDHFQYCGEFYMQQNSDICAEKYAVKKILLQKIKVAFSMLSRNECAEILKSVGFVTNVY